MNKIGVYIHFPYCEKKCPYCDFNSHVAKKIDDDAFLEAYKVDFDYYLSQLEQKTRTLESIFFGGGTPSLMHPALANGIIEYIKQKCIGFGIKIAENLEITLEANPSSFETGKFIDFKNAGINRVSIGVQSFIEEDLKALGRVHNKMQAVEAIYAAREIFERFSFDLIYGRQHQTMQMWESELELALKEFKPNHISLYTLTIEKGTQFFKLHKEGKLILPENQDDFYALTNAICKNHGLERYEISNYSKPQNECKHNILYWTGKEYIGIGPGAHGRIDTKNGRTATMNYNEPEKYLKKIQEMQNAAQNFTTLSNEDIALEMIAMGLRTKNGFDLEIAKDYIDLQNVEILCNEGMLIVDGNIIKPNDKGLDFCDGIQKFIIKQ